MVSTAKKIGVSISTAFGYQFRRRLVAVVIAINFVVLGLSALTLYRGYDSALKTAQKDAHNVARPIEQSLADTIERFDMTLKTVIDEVADQTKNAAFDKHALHSFLVKHHAQHPEMYALAVFDANGHALVGSTYRPGDAKAGSLQIASQTYFQHLRDQPDAGLHVTGRLMDQGSGDPVIVLARRINRPGGAFAGVAVASIDIARLTFSYAQYEIGKHGVVELLGGDMRYIARYPETEQAQMEKSEQAMAMNSSLPSVMFMRSKQQYGNFTEMSLVDGIERFVSVRRLGNFSLYQIVGMAKEDYLSKWWRDVYVFSSGLLLFFLTTVVMAVQLNDSWNKRRSLIRQLDKRQKKFQTLAAMSADWFWEQDENYCFTEVSKDLAVHGKNPAVLPGKTRWELKTDKSEEEWIAHRAMLEARQPFYNFEYCVLDDQGQKRCMSISGEPVFDDNGRFLGYQGVGRDVTEKKNYDERIERLALYDNLTELPNRTLFYDRTDQAISVAKREQSSFALLYFDLDRFKPVNDRYGHLAGDQLLKMAASRIRYVLRETDTVARLGGDEFVVLLLPTSNEGSAEIVAQKIILALTSPYKLDAAEENVAIGVSIGIALYPKDGANRDSLLNSADSAMYKAKQTGNSYAFFGQSKEA